MKRNLKIIVSVVVLLLLLSLSLNIVFAVNQGAEPGSEQDPIISKSYVDAAVTQMNEALAKLQTEVNALKAENTQLAAKVADQEQIIKDLQGGTYTGKTGSSAGKDGSDKSSSGKSSTTTNTGINSNGKGTVNTAVLNIRKQPNTTSAIAAKAAKGDILTLVSKSGDWYKVKTSKGVTGYVMASLITVK